MLMNHTMQIFQSGGARDALQLRKELDQIWPQFANSKAVECSRGTFVKDHFCLNFMPLFVHKHTDEILERFEIGPREVFGPTHRSSDPKMGRGASHSMIMKYLLEMDHNDQVTRSIASFALFGAGVGNDITKEWLDMYDVCVKLMDPSLVRDMIGDWRSNPRKLVQKWTLLNIDPMSRLLSPVAWETNNAETCRNEMAQLLCAIEQVVGHDVGGIVWSFINFPSRQNK